jgi:hypothetical protein
MTRVVSRFLVTASVGFALLSGAAQAQTVPPPPAPPPPPYGAPPVYEHPFLFGDSTYRSPGLAVALSLTPVPVDFGNLYAENLGWGVAYTAVEVSLMAPMMWLGGTHMDHMGDSRRWSDGERGAMVALVGSYVAVKLVAGVHAGYAAGRFNRRYEPRPIIGVLPVRGGAALGLGATF